MIKPDEDVQRPAAADEGVETIEELIREDLAECLEGMADLRNLLFPECAHRITER